MFRLLMLIILVALAAPPAQAAIAPVQVSIQDEDIMFLFDCWPAPHDALDEGQTMTVFLNYPTGLASYICDYRGEAWLMPFLPRKSYQMVGGHAWKMH